MKFSQSSCCWRGCGADGMMEDEFFCPVIPEYHVLALGLVPRLPRPSCLWSPLSLASCFLPILSCPSIRHCSFLLGSTGREVALRLASPLQISHRGPLKDALVPATNERIRCHHAIRSGSVLLHDHLFALILVGSSATTSHSAGGGIGYRSGERRSYQLPRLAYSVSVHRSCEEWEYWC